MGLMYAGVLGDVTDRPLKKSWRGCPNCRVSRDIVVAELDAALKTREGDSK